MAENLGETGGRAARVYCSETNATEPLAGTADNVDVWLCLEYKTAWKAKAVADNDLSGATRRWLENTLEGLGAAGLKARPQFVRQPGTDRADTRLLVAVAGRAFEFSGQGYGFLEALDLVGHIDDPGWLAERGSEIVEPIYLVCTNGQRDLCCARFGLPVYAALTERLGDRAWQVTHLGGHRFAPNVLTLPDGCLYGRVHPECVDDFLARTESGAVDFERLRGRSRYPAIVQAAEAALARQGLRLLHVEGDEALATVQFADEGGRVQITMGRAAQPALVTKSCGDEAPAQVYPFEPR